jgi:hypothetical protein
MVQCDDRSRVPDNHRDIAALNFFRATELHGALIIGQLVRRTSDPGLIHHLTRCCVRQVVHSMQLAESIVALGGCPGPVRATYQDLLAEVAGAPVTAVEALVMTQTVDRWMNAHFPARAANSDSGWIQSWLDEHSRKHGTEVNEVRRRYAHAEMRIVRLSEGNRSSALDNLRQPPRIPVGKPNASV